MASLPSEKYYKNFCDMSPIRAIVETLMNSQSLKKPNLSELYDMASELHHVTITDRPIHEKIIKQYKLPENARVLNDNHGMVIGRAASARRFFNRVDESTKKKLHDIALEAAFELSKQKLMLVESFAGLDENLMLKARLICPESYASNAYNWCLNFTPKEMGIEKFKKSKNVNIPDICILTFPDWKSDDPQFSKGCVIVDEKHNTIMILGLRYFGELKKGTLTLAWTSGMNLEMAACHGGIKEVDFSNCKDENNKKHGKKIISFFGLSGSGKSSHTNSHDNSKTLPEDVKVTIAHDDAFQIDPHGKMCYVWEPSLFDKTDSRELDHPDWKYVISTQNHAIVKKDNKILPYGRDLRNKNSRAIFSRNILENYVNKVDFPHFINWLMKDSTLPPVMKFSSSNLAVAMGATLMTKRTAAENVSEEEMKKLVFEPFANPFRVYELYKDCVAFRNLFEQGVEGHVFNSAGFWNGSDDALHKIPLELSHRLQTAILKNEITWVEHPFIKGGLIPEKNSIEKIWPGYSEKFSTDSIEHKNGYMELLSNRFEQRREFLLANVEKLELARELADSLIIS